MKKYLINCKNCKGDEKKPHIVWKISRLRGVRYICDVCAYPSHYFKQIPDEFQESGGEE